MSETTAIQKVNGGVQAIVYSDQQIDLLKTMVCPKETTDDELGFFLTYAQRTGLDPFARQIYCMKDKTGRFRVETTVDGFRLCAERTGDYQGQEDPLWCGEDGQWKDVWLSKEPPAACRVGVYRKGFQAPIRAVALFDAYKQEHWDYQEKKRKLSPQWEKNGANMLSKCAECLALRKAFPRELSGLYTKEEMEQATEHQPQANEFPDYNAREYKGHLYRTDKPVHDLEHGSAEYCAKCKELAGAPGQHQTGAGLVQPSATVSSAPPSQYTGDLNWLAKESQMPRTEKVDYAIERAKETRPSQASPQSPGVSLEAGSGEFSGPEYAFLDNDATEGKSEPPVAAPPQCPKCQGEMKLVPPGQTKTGKKYGAFWGCKKGKAKCGGTIHVHMEKSPDEDEYESAWDRIRAVTKCSGFDIDHYLKQFGQLDEKTKKQMVIGLAKHPDEAIQQKMQAYITPL